MAEQEGILELEVLKKELESLFVSNSNEQPGLKSKLYCAQFCKLVEVYTGQWQVPLPQLQVLKTALSSFVHASSGFPCNCEHVHYTLSSLALSVFELLLFLKKDNFLQDPLKDVLDSFQDCFSQLDRYQNIHLLQVRQIIRDKGPWTSPVLQAILKDNALDHDEVERYIGSEVPVFFELRVRYLLSCFMIHEAVVLAKTCSQHPTAGRHLFFLQAYFTCLCKASLYDHLCEEMCEVDGKDAVEIVCNTEKEESNDTLLDLCRAFLSRQLQRGDMYYMWDLVFIWGKLCLRVNPAKQAFLEEIHQFLLCATNINSIFPFIRVILAELGKEGLQFCVELCTHALQTDSCDMSTKSLLYKTVAYLLPNDLEICRACALLVFFLERTVEAYKTVFLLYTHPDQEYYAEAGPIGNHVRFEILQTLKRGLYFDPEFWNLLNLRTNCLKLMSEKKAAQAEIMEEDKWVSNYCNTIPKEPCRSWGADPSEHSQTRRVAETKQAQAKQAPAKHVQIKPFHQVTEPKKRFHREEKNGTSTAQVEAKRVKTQRSDGSEEKTSVEPQQPVNNVNPVVASQSRIKIAGHTVVVEEKPVVKRRGRKPGPKPRTQSPVKAAEPSAESSIRRSFRQLDTAYENLDRQSNHIQHRHMTRLSEKKPPKRLGRKPQWLLEGTFQAETRAPRKGRKPGRKPQQQKSQQTVEKTNNSQSLSDLVKESKAKQKNAGTTQVKTLGTCLAAREPECKMEISTSNHLPPVAIAPESQLEVSLPDNELLLVLPEDHLSKQRLVLLNADKVKPSVQTYSQVKDRHKGEFILSTQNPSLFIQELHSYAQMPEMEGVNLNAKDVRPYLNQSCLPVLDSTSAVSYQMSAVGVKGEFSSQTAIPTATNMTVSSQRFFANKDVQDKYTPLFPSTNVIVSNIPSKGRTPESDWEVANGPKQLTANEVSDLESMSRDVEVTDILKEAMNIANIGLEEAMMDDTDTSSISEKEMPLIVNPHPTSFCWISNTSMDAFAKEFEKFAKGTDTEIGQNYEAVSTQDTDITLKTLQTTSTSLTQNLKNIISDNTPQDTTDPLVLPGDTQVTSQLNQTQNDTQPTQQDKRPHREENNHDNPRDSDNMSLQTEQDIQFEGTLQKQKDIQTPTENIQPTTDETPQLQAPLKSHVLQSSLLSTQHIAEVPVDQDPPKITKGPSENALNVQQQTDDPLNATMDTRPVISVITEDSLNVTISEVTADMLQVSEKSTKAIMGTPNVSVDMLAQISHDSLQLGEDLQKNRDDISQEIKDCPLKDLAQDSSDTTRQLVIVDTVDVPEVTVVSRICSVITEDVLKITDNILNDSSDSLKESQDSMQNTEFTQKVPEKTHQPTTSTPPVSDAPQQYNITNEALQHPDDPTKKTVHTQEVNEFNVGTQQNTYDLSVIVEDPPKVTKDIPRNIHDNSLVVSKPQKFSESPKGSVKKAKGSNHTHTVTKNTTKVTKDSPQKANYTSKVTKYTPMVSGESVQNPEEATPHETVDCQLAYCCSLCNKVFNGEHVIGHAMYHFRKDQCMFCAMLFTDDLVAMMHLSEHIDQLKKGNIKAEIQEVRENTAHGTAEKSERSASRGKRGRKKAPVKTTGTTESSPPDRRELRSTNRLSTDCRLLAVTTEKTEQCDAKQSIQKVNGHIGRERVERMKHDGQSKAVRKEHSGTRHGKELSSLETKEEPVELSTSLVKINIGVGGGSSKTLKKVKTCSSVTTMEVKMGCPSIAMERQTRHQVSPPEKLVQLKEPARSCPVEGCSEILAVKSRAGLGHILDYHHGEAKFLEIAFCHWNGKCSICQKQGLTLLHYQHHVERHRETPRHPCLHNGCKARFGSVAEMKNHAKTHRPLQAVCCFPGCKQRLSCFLDLNRHELEHYPPPMEQREKRQKMRCKNGRWVCRRKKTSATDSASNIKVTRKCDLTKKFWNTQVHKKRQVHKGKDTSTPIMLKMTDKLRVNKKLCVGNSMDNSTAPNKMTTPKQSEKVTRQFKMINKLKKAKVVKSRHGGKEKDTSTPTPNLTITTQKVTRKSKVIDKLMKMQVIKKQNVSEEMDTPTGPATNAKVTEKLKLINELKKTKQPVQKRSATKKKTLDTKKKKTSDVDTNKDTATVPCTIHSKCKKLEPKNTVTTALKTLKTTPKSCSSTVKSPVATLKSCSTKSKSHITTAKTTIKKGNKLGNKRYVRPLRTAYLDKSYTTMPKRRKETRALEPFYAQTTAPSTTMKVTRKCNFNKKLDKTQVIKKQQFCKGKDITTAPPATTVKVTKNLRDKRKLCVGKKLGVPMAHATITEKVTKNLKMTNHLRKVQVPKSLHVSKEKLISAPLTTNPVTATEILAENPKVKDELKKTKQAVQKQSVKTNLKKTSSVNTKNNTATFPLTTESKSKKCSAQNTKTITPTCSTAPSTSLNTPSKTHKALPQSPTTPPTTHTANVKSPIATLKTPTTPSISPITKEEGPTSFYGMIGKKPYIRPPPTSYLDESYTTMQKRRKEMSWTPHDSSSHPDQVEAALAIQRQRCTKCFLPFNSAKELQMHLLLKKCTTLFGFDDSDEEGNR